MKVAIGPSSFAELDPTPLEMLRDHGFEVIPNDLGRRLDAEEISERLADAEGLIAGLEPLNRSVLLGAQKLRAIARVGVGLDTVDLATAAELDIRVSNTPSAPVDAVAEMTVGAMIALSRTLTAVNSALHQGRWEKRIGKSLGEMTVLIVGFGRIGRAVARLLEPFGPSILVCDPEFTHLGSDGLMETSLEEGLARADLVTLHAGGSATILDAAAFDLMPSGALVLNCGRGGLIDEQALIVALDSGKVAGAWLDVFSVEPYTGPLLDYEQVILTPHIATYTRSTRSRMEREAVENLLQDLSADS